MFLISESGSKRIDNFRLIFGFLILERLDDESNSFEISIFSLDFLSAKHDLFVLSWTKAYLRFVDLDLCYDRFFCWNMDESLSKSYFCWNESPLDKVCVVNIF